MTIKERFTQIVLLRGNRSKLIAAAVALALLAGLLGLLIGRSLAPEPAVVEEKQVAKEEQGAEGFVPVSAAQLAAAGIVVEQVEPGSIAMEVIGQATVTAPPEGQALVTARADGAIVRMNKRLGDPARAGETIALLESREAAALVAAQNAAAAQAQAARAAAAREQRLFNAKVTARQDLEASIAARQIAEAEQRRAQAAVRTAGVVNGQYLAVRSPISGRITEVDTQLGAYVSAGAELFNVSDPSRIQIEAAIPAPEAQRVQAGDRAFVELPQGGIVDAAVRSITPSVDPQSRAATVVLQVTGAPGGLRQGQAVRVRIMPRMGEARGIILPEEAVQQVEGRDVVFVQVKGGFQAVPIQLGQRSGGRVEILEGLQPGQVVVTRGAFVLKSQLGASEAEH